MQKTQELYAKGYCYGNYWGGGRGAYSSIVFQAETEEELRTKITKAIDDGSIDSGMGYESMLGAIMAIKTWTTVTIDGEQYTNTKTDIQLFGNLSEEDQEFLINCMGE